MFPMIDFRKSITVFAAIGFGAVTAAPFEARAHYGYSGHDHVVADPGAWDEAMSIATSTVLDLPAGLPKAFSVTIPFSGQRLTLRLEKHEVFGENTRFLVSDGKGGLTEIERGLDRSYLGRVAERPDFAVSAVLTEGGLIATVLRPGQAAIAVEPFRGTGIGSLHMVSTGSAADYRGDAPRGETRTVAPPTVPEAKETAASSGPTTTVFMETGKTGAPAIESAATLPPTRVMNVLEYEIGVEIGSKAFYADTAYNGDLAYAQSVAQGLVGNLDARFLRSAGVKNRLGTVIIRTDVATDPLIGTVTKGDSSSLYAFRNYWNDHSGEVGNTHDLAVYHVKYAPSGIAFVNSVGGSYRYALSCGNGATSWADGTIAHEFGHSWNLKHVGDAPISEYDYEGGGAPPGQFYEAKPRNGSGSSSAGGDHVFVSIMHGGGSHNIGRLATDEANTVQSTRQSKSGYGDPVASPGAIAPFGYRDMAVTTGDPITIDVIANDYDCNNDVLDAELLDTVSQRGGTISLSVGTGPGGRNEIIYTPLAGVNGIDFFHYTVRDATGRSDWCAVYVDNAGPVVVDTTLTAYNYDLGPAGSPVLSDWMAITPDTTGDIHWTGGSIGSADRGSGDGVNDANRDFVYGREDAQLNHTIANGIWAITINMGDKDYSHDLMGVRAEGMTLRTGLNSAAGEFPYVNGEVTVTDGELNFEFFDDGGSDPNWAITRLSLTKVADILIVDTDETSYNYDLGPFDSPVMTGWTGITPLTQGDVFWSGDAISSRDRDPGGRINDINRDFIQGSGTSRLNHKLAAGVWRVVFNMGDSDFEHDLMGVRAEGTLITDSITSPAEQFSYVDENGASTTPTSFDVVVTDGELTLEFFDNGGSDPNWVVTRMSLTKMGEANILVDTTLLSYDYDLGPVGSPVESGYAAITEATVGDIFWSGEAVTSQDRGTDSDLLRDFVGSSGSSTLNHKLASGIWDIVLEMGDSDYFYDLVRVRAEGFTIASNLTASIGIVHTVTGRVTVTDGDFNLEFFDDGGRGSGWVLNRLSLRRVDGPIVLIDPTTNDGSFESLDDNGIGDGSNDHKMDAGASEVVGSDATPGASGVFGGVWTVSHDGDAEQGGWLDRGPATPYASDGLIGMFQDGGRRTTSLTTVASILGVHGYTTVREGDVFSFSFDHNGESAGTGTYSSLRLSFDGGSRFLTIGTGANTDGDESAFQTTRGTYTATAADATSAATDGLLVQFVLIDANGNNWSDNVRLSVTPVRRILGMARNPDQTMTFSWDSEVGASYTLRYAPALGTPMPGWAIENDNIPSGGTTSTYRTTTTFPGNAHFFAVEKN